VLRGRTRTREVLARIAPLPPATVTPDPSLRLSRYGRRCKPGLSQSYNRPGPGLQHPRGRSEIGRAFYFLLVG
jgi:hypothetical protein